jgi:colanic acid/amylovoran biosynthesis glycosyltransferase
MAPVAQVEGVPLVVGFYGRDISALPKESFWRGAYRDLWSQVEAVTVLSEDMASKAHQLECPPEKTTVVHLSRDLDQFPFHSPERTVQTVLFVGRLTPKKAPLDAIQAVELANAQGADLSLELIGDGTLRRDVEQYVREQHLQETVTIRGKVPSAEIASHMQKADAFILPSKTPSSGDEEGTPTVLVEAQASGLPCVSTWHAGIPEMIPEAHHDLLVAEGDVSGLAECLSRLSARSGEELIERAERGRRYVEQEFNLTGEVKKLRGVYEKAVAAWV